MNRKSPHDTCLQVSRSSQRKIGHLFNRAIIESPIPIIIHDENDHILQMSKGWTRFSGYTLEDIPTLGDWTQRAYGERKDTLKQHDDELFKADQTVDYGEWVITAKDGTKRVWHFMVTPLGFFEGRRLLLAMAVDVTERQRAEEALRKTEELLKQGVRVACLG